MKFLQENRFNQPVTESTDWVLAYTIFIDQLLHIKPVTDPTGLVYRQRNTSEVTRLTLEHQATGPADLPKN